VQKISPTHRADLTLGEKSRQRNLAQAFLYHGAVMIRPSEEAFPAPATAEQETAERRTPVFPSIRGQQEMKIVACGLRVSYVELHRLSFLNRVADGDRPRPLVGPDQIADEEIALFEPIAMFVDDDADVKGLMRVPALGTFQRFEHVLKAREGGPAA